MTREGSDRPDNPSQTNPGLPIEGELRDARDVHDRIEAAGPHFAPADGEAMRAEHSVSGHIPREEKIDRRFRSSDVYVRLENTVYGPLERDTLAELLASGQLTGYESASSDLQHWTPLLYHPRMNLTGHADPDATHGLLHAHSTLPTASKNPRRDVLEDLADGKHVDLPTFEEPRPPATPLAAIMIKPRTITVRKKDLPVYGTATGEGDQTRVEPASVAVHARPPHPSDNLEALNTPYSASSHGPFDVPAAAPGVDAWIDAGTTAAHETAPDENASDENASDDDVTTAPRDVVTTARGNGWFFNVLLVVLMLALVAVLVFILRA